MTLLDRYMLLRFFTNFVILFVLLFVFAVAIDFIVALDRFVAAAQQLIGDDAGIVRTIWTIASLAADFEAPRFFQFYAFSHGLVAVGAMGFTLAQMHRHRELVAMLSAGISMHRIAMPFVVAMFGLSVIQLVNQEVLLPRVAPLLLRDHDQIGRRRLTRFPVSLTPDSRRSLFQSPSFDPRTERLSDLTILERDEGGRTVRRVTADAAVWVDPETAGPEATPGWTLENGRAVTLARRDRPSAGESPGREIDFYASDLSPRVLLVHRYAQFAGMLSLRQIARMLETPDVADRPALLRHRYARFAVVLVNILVMWLALPAFLLRQPANLLRCAIVCAAITLPSMLGAAIFMVMDLPGIAPAVGVFLPVVILIPIVLAQWTYVRT